MYKKELEQIGNELIEEIRKRMSDKDLNSTGNASRSLNTKATETKLEIKGERYIGALDQGRKPGKFPPLQKIIDYVKREGIDFVINGKSIGIESTAYLMGKGMAENGSIIYRDRTKGIELESIVDMGIQLIKKRITAQFLIDTKAKIIDLSKGAMA